MIRETVDSIEILFPRHYGMCFGVRDALAATDAIADPSGVTIFGALVHNDTVSASLQMRGFLQMNERDRATPTTPKVLITAHGVSGAERGRLAAAGLEILDTTCPLVRHAHAAALTLDAQGRFIVVVGERDHVEVRGLTGDLRHWMVIAGPDDACALPHARIGIIAQTTTRPDVLDATVATIQQLNPDADVRVMDTICKPTRDRQESVGAVLQQCDLWVVVGGARSRNTMELARRGISAGIPTQHIQSAANLDADWFHGVRTVGVGAGTSTPDAVIEDVHQRILQIAADRGRGARTRYL